VYVGSAKNLKSRWRTHLCRLRHNNHHNQFLLNDFVKCGEYSFQFVILEECDVEHLIEREQFWLNQHYDNQVHCYNLRKVAESNQGFKMSDTTKKKMSEVSKGRKPSSQTIEASRLATLGKKRSEETRAKIANYQQNRTTEHKKKLGISIKSVWQNPDYRKRQSKAHQKPRPYRLKLVNQYTLENVKVASYFGVKEAARITGLRASGISQAAVGSKKTCGGFIWKYEE
jgi:group I intron endonuclease